VIGPEVQEHLLHPLPERHPLPLVPAEHDPTRHDAELQPQRRIVQHEQVNIIPAERGGEPVVQARIIEQRTFRAQRHRQVDIATRADLTTGQGTEQVDEAHPIVRLRDRPEPSGHLLDGLQRGTVHRPSPPGSHHPSSFARRTSATNSRSGSFTSAWIVVTTGQGHADGQIRQPPLGCA
jgi:hypothetical protein